MFFIHLSSEATSGTIASGDRWDLKPTRGLVPLWSWFFITVYKAWILKSHWPPLKGGEILFRGLTGQVSMNQHYWCQSRSNIAVIEFDGYRGQSVDVAARGGDICHVNLDPGVLRHQWEACCWRKGSKSMPSLQIHEFIIFIHTKTTKNAICFDLLIGRILCCDPPEVKVFDIKKIILRRNKGAYQDYSTWLQTNIIHVLHHVILDQLNVMISNHWSTNNRFTKLVRSTVWMKNQQLYKTLTYQATSTNSAFFILWMEEIRQTS